MTDSPSQTSPTALHQINLETPRLILRAAQPSDNVPLYEAFKDEETMRYWSTPPHTSLETTSNWITSMINSPQNGITDFIITLKEPLSLSTSPSDTTTSYPLPIGKIGIYRPPPSNEIGFILVRDYWSHGLAKEAQTYILRYLFSITQEQKQERDLSLSSQPPFSDSASDPHSKTPDATISSYTTLPPTSPSSSPYLYPSITADVDPRNTASRGILTRMGFTESGCVEKTDHIGGEWVDSVYYEVRREVWMGR